MIGHDTIQAEISARLDGETGHLSNDVVEAHLAECSSCRDYYRRALALQQVLDESCAPMRGGVAQDRAPEITEAILASVEPEWRRSRPSVLPLIFARIMLVVAAVIYLVWSWQILSGTLATPVPGLVFDAEVSSLLVQAAVVRIAIAAALCVGAWRPRLLRGFLPFFSAYVSFTVIFGVRDLIQGVASSAVIVELGTLIATVILVIVTVIVEEGVARWKERIGQLGASPRG